jgi:hypothetical protein
MATLRIASSIALAALLSGCPAKKDSDRPSPNRPAPTPAASQPAEAASQPGGAAPSANAVPPFSGEVVLGGDVAKDKLKPTDVLFIIARESMGGQPGRLIATQRHVDVKFPLHFEMTQKDLMVPGSAFSGPFIVNARLDRDGDPMTKSPDDFYAVHEGEVKGGETNLKLELKTATMVPGAPPSQPQSQPAAKP